MPRFVAPGQRRTVVGRPRREARLPHRPAQPRHISFAATASLPSGASTGHTLEGVSFEELVEFVEAQYGLAERFIRGSLSELAEILGYHVGVDPIIQYTDAGILMEEIGAPPLTQQQLSEFKASRIDLKETAEEETREDNLGDDDLHGSEQPTVEPFQSGLPTVFVSHPPRLFRGR